MANIVLFNVIIYPNFLAILFYPDLASSELRFIHLVALP